MNILDNFKSLLFCCHTLGNRCTIDVLDSENQPGFGKIPTGSGALGLTGDVYTKSMKTKKKALKLSKIVIVLKISLHSSYRALDSNLGQNRIQNPAAGSRKKLTHFSLMESSYCVVTVL